MKSAPCVRVQPTSSRVHCRRRASARGRGFGVAVLAALLAPCGSSLQAAAPGYSSSVAVNGVRLDLRILQLHGRFESLEAALAAQWAGDSAAGGRTATALGERLLFGRQRGPFHETLTLFRGEKAGPHTVVIAVQDLRRSPASLPRPPLPLPAQVRLISAVQWAAPSGESTFSLTSQLPAQRALEQLLVQAARSGWAGRAAGAGIVAAEGSVRWLRRGAQELTIVATPSRYGSAITLQLVAARPGFAPERAP